MQSFFEFAGPGATDATAWPHRPVDVAVGARGQLFVTSDASNTIFWIGHNGTQSHAPPTEAATSSIHPK